MLFWLRRKAWRKDAPRGGSIGRPLFGNTPTAKLTGSAVMRRSAMILPGAVLAASAYLPALRGRLGTLLCRGRPPGRPETRERDVEDAVPYEGGQFVIGGHEAGD